MAPNTTANPNIRFKNRRDHTRRVAFMCGFLPAIALLLTLCLGPNPLTMGQSAALTPMIAESTDIPDPTPLVRLDYPNVLGETPLSLARGGLYLNVENNTADPLIVSVESRSISGSVDGTRMVQQLSLAPFYKTSLILDPSLMPVAKDSEAFASQFLLTGYVFDSAGRLLRKEQAPELFYPSRCGRCTVRIPHTDQQGHRRINPWPSDRDHVGGFDRRGKTRSSAGGPQDLGNGLRFWKSQSLDDTWQMGADLRRPEGELFRQRCGRGFLDQQQRQIRAWRPPQGV